MKKKLIVLIFLLLIPIGCSQKTYNIQLDFEAQDVQSLEIFTHTHPNDGYKYVVTDPDKINHLVTVLTGIKCTANRDLEIPLDSPITIFRFHLQDRQMDVTHIELGIKNGIIYSPNHFDYRTQADMRGFLTDGLQGERVTQEELPYYGN